MKNLRYVLVVTHFGPKKGAESFEIRPPTVHSNFTVESKNPLQDLPKLDIVSALNICHLCFLYIFTKMGGSLMYFSAFN